MTVHLILASQSPRRRELIKLLGLPFSAISANVNEDSITDPNPAVNVIKTAELKAQTIAAQIQPTNPSIIIAADTTVALDNEMLGKPQNTADAERMLLTLRGRTHEVYTGTILVDMRSGEMVKGVCTAVVTMRPYTKEEINTYIATGDPLDKAGAYAIQHPQFSPVAHLNGCYLGVVGLSICHLLQLLNQLNICTKPNLATLHAAHQTTPCPLFELVSKKI
ncbi:MAG: septum formation protein Maf [Ardenticatenaceae bacterium]|nr:septum formation protein Maf [Ardenticatenaceae bacterium]